MKENNYLSRRYLYPLISNFPTYRGLSSAKQENLPIATTIADEVLCLSMHHTLTEKDIERILNCFI